MPEASPPRPARRPAGWGRLVLAQALQIPSVLLVLAGRPPWSWWAAALWASLACCALTDSGWRWRNRLLLAQAVAWLVAAAL